MKLNIKPLKRRSWKTIITDEGGAQVATTSPATPAELCGLLDRVDGIIDPPGGGVGSGALVTSLRVEAHSVGWVLVDGQGRQIGVATRLSSFRHNVYVTFAGEAGTVRWAPARGWHRRLEAVRHEGRGGKELSATPVGTFERASCTRCTCTADFDDGVLPVEAQIFLTWLGVQLLRDAQASSVGAASGGGAAAAGGF